MKHGESAIRLSRRVIRRGGKIRRKGSAEARTGQILVQAPCSMLVSVSEDEQRMLGARGLGRDGAWVEWQRAIDKGGGQAADRQADG
jgi:hypothetical protein